MFPLGPMAAGSPAPPDVYRCFKRLGKDGREKDSSRAVADRSRDFLWIGSPKASKPPDFIERQTIGAQSPVGQSQVLT